MNKKLVLVAMLAARHAKASFTISYPLRSFFYWTDGIPSDCQTKLYRKSLATTIRGATFKRCVCRWRDSNPRGDITNRYHDAKKDARRLWPTDDEHQDRHSDAKEQYAENDEAGTTQKPFTGEIEG